MEKGNPAEILARTFGRGDDTDHEFLLGRAEAARENLNAAGWRVFRLNPRAHPDMLLDDAIEEEWTP